MRSQVKSSAALRTPSIARLRLSGPHSGLLDRAVARSKRSSKGVTQVSTLLAALFTVVKGRLCWVNPETRLPQSSLISVLTGKSCWHPDRGR